MVLASQKTLPPRYVYLHLLWESWEQNPGISEHSSILAFFMSISQGPFETHRLVSNIGLKEVIAACLSNKYRLNSK